MNIGWIGLGKLGLPCALALSKAGHAVYGYDINPAIGDYLEQGKVPYEEDKVEKYMEDGATVYLQDSIEDVVGMSDVVFIAVQTPHSPEYEGHVPIPSSRRDFEYQYLVDAYREVNEAVDHLSEGWQFRDTPQKMVPVVVVSTVLPGTFDRLLRPLTDRWVTPIYNPFFIAMGTTIPDFEDPEFVLIGADNMIAAHDILEEVYDLVHNKPYQPMSIASAELTKVAYNTFIGMKIVFANTIMEICHKTSADSDDVVSALSAATDRLISPKYLRGGMGDGGGCHPRDNIAMSWLAERLELSHNFFDDIMMAREDQTRFLIDLAFHWQKMTKLPIVLMGSAFKANLNLEVGSPGLLMANMMGNPPVIDPHVITKGDNWTGPAVYVVTTNHDYWLDYKFAPGSVVIDPWAYIPHQEGVTVIPVGRKR